LKLGQLVQSQSENIVRSYLRSKSTMERQPTARVGLTWHLWSALQMSSVITCVTDIVYLRANRSGRWFLALSWH